jgi:choline monooxygenase
MLHDRQENGCSPQGSQGKKSDEFRREDIYAATRRSVESTTTLIPDAYRSPTYYEAEEESLFGRAWVCVGYTSQVRTPGDTFRATVAGQPIFITRDRSGGLRAFYNVCRHRGSLLVAEDGRRDFIRCPYHAWGYGLDGRLLGTPYFKELEIPDGEECPVQMVNTDQLRKENFGLLPVRVESWGCFVFVNLDSDAPPLHDWLGDLPERLARFPLDQLQLVRSRDFRIEANWKLIAENFMEYYHLPWVHPELCTISGFKDHYRNQGPGMYTGMCTSPLARSPALVSFDLPVMPGLEPFEAQSAFWILIFPNVALFLLPDHLFTLLFRPDGPQRTVEVASMLVHPEALEDPQADAKIDRVLSFWAMVNNQDIKAVEGVQKGLQVRAYPGGRLSARFEEPVHRFQNMVIDRMTGLNRTPAGDAQEDPALTAIKRQLGCSETKAAGAGDVAQRL